MDIKKHNINALESAFNLTETDNGDEAFVSTTNKLIDLVFYAESLNKNADRETIEIGKSNLDKLVSAFIRDPRHGIGKRDLGRKLLKQTEFPIHLIPQVGRYDDLIKMFGLEGALIVAEQAKKGDELAKKWLPRESSGIASKHLARDIAKALGMTSREYRKMIRSNTTETLVNLHTNDNGVITYTHRDSINFGHVPSLARLKWSSVFNTIPAYEEYLNQVAAGKAKINFATGTVVDIVRNMKEGKISKREANLLAKEIEVPAMSILPIIDVSGSMGDWDWGSNDPIHKALALGIAFAKHSTYMGGGYTANFSKTSELCKIDPEAGFVENIESFEKLNKRRWGQSTNLVAVLENLKRLGRKDLPEYLLVLSDMQFNYGSSSSLKEFNDYLRENNINCKLIWWNLSEGARTAPITLDSGNIFLSGYSPRILSAMESGFDMEMFLAKLLTEYALKAGLEDLLHE